MGLKPIKTGLRPVRRVRLDSNQTAKVQVHVPPGDELEVSEDVAVQLIAADSHFKPAENVAGDMEKPEKPKAKKTPAKKRAGRPRKSTS